MGGYCLPEITIIGTAIRSLHHNEQLGACGIVASIKEHAELWLDEFLEGIFLRSSGASRIRHFFVHGQEK